MVMEQRYRHFILMRLRIFYFSEPQKSVLSEKFYGEKDGK